METEWFRNGANVEGSTHKHVVDLIKSGGDVLTLTVISVPRQVAERLEPSDESSGPSTVDYSDKRSLPITIPDYETLRDSDSRFIVYHIHMAGRHLCSRRYREFSNIHNILKREFPDFQFPKFPGKWPFTMSEQQLDARRRGLEQYLEKVCSVRVIADSDGMQEFLGTQSENGTSDKSEVQLKILLPDKNIASIIISKDADARKVHSLVTKKIGMKTEIAKHFALFEIVDTNFDRKIMDQEQPHSIYIQNYNTAAPSCIALKKWLFNIELEKEILYEDQLARSFVFHNVTEDISKGNIKVKPSKVSHINVLKKANRIDKYLLEVASFDNYGEIAFPHCSCDSRKDGHVVARVSFTAFRLQACKEDGTVENQVIEFSWKDISSFESDYNGSSFNFEYERPGKKPRLVRIFTNFHTFLEECFKKVKSEIGAKEVIQED
ncbi:DgyrCDS10562 [Dimorphilus gyrociliatus]|uniref:DgyrCDS10562 n=1 Tax=Dimorphilus gyrociliatus TaxID=2664684 RepID=A0A7I8W0Q3_9ANNE|nr:DgyrCDS10562 [Dimorphilus gyrociliatus]